VLQAALNGDRSAGEHPSIPIAPEALAQDAAACVAAGAGAIHLHPRDSRGHETLDAAVVDAVVRYVRGACGVPVGVTTGAWIEDDVDERVAFIEGWSEPDYSSVNLAEDGAERVMAALLSRGVGVEAGVATVEDADRLAASGVADRVLRVLVEPVDADPDDAASIVAQIHATLDRHEIHAPRLQHGDGTATWVLISDAVRRGLDTRVGLEDTLVLPGGSRADGNPALIAAARAMGAL
jgi:uncharacterized protein (DUF849 family)